MNVIIPEILVKVENNQIPTIASNNSNSIQTLLLKPVELKPVTEILTITHNFDKTNERLTRLINCLRLSHLTEDEQKILIELVSEYQHVFSLDGDKPNSKITRYHEIKTTSDKSIYAKNYRFPAVHKGESRKTNKRYVKKWNNKKK